MSEQILDRPQTAAPQGVLPGIDSENEKPSSRKRNFVVVGLAVVAGLVLGGVMLFVMQPGAEDEVVDPVTAAAAAAAVTEAEAQSAAVAEEAAAGDAAATTTKVKITSRDPFAPLVPKPAPAPVKAAQAAAPDASSSSSSSTGGATISALTISAKGDSVKLKLDGKKYDVDEGESFAKSYRLYDIFNDNCAGFLYGDLNAVVCEGDSVTIG
jgi:hypothetical protein